MKPEILAVPVHGMLNVEKAREVFGHHENNNMEIRTLPKDEETQPRKMSRKSANVLSLTLTTTSRRYSIYIITVVSISSTKYSSKPSAFDIISAKSKVALRESKWSRYTTTSTSNKLSAGLRRIMARLTALHHMSTSIPSL